MDNRKTLFVDIILNPGGQALFRCPLRLTQLTKSRG